MFQSMQMAPPDAILGLNEQFRNDNNPNKINLGVGVYKDDSGITPILDCVKRAEQQILDQENWKMGAPLRFRLPVEPVLCG